VSVSESVIESVVPGRGTTLQISTVFHQRIHSIVYTGTSEHTRRQTREGTGSCSWPGLYIRLCRNPRSLTSYNVRVLVCVSLCACVCARVCACMCCVCVVVRSWAQALNEWKESQVKEYEEDPYSGKNTKSRKGFDLMDYCLPGLWPKA